MQSYLEHELRMKCASVIYALESALGEFTQKIVYEDPENFKNKELEKRLDGSLESNSWADIIESSNFMEVVDNACRASLDTAYEEPMKKLRQHIDKNDICDVRNRVCHSTRPINENHWCKLLELITSSYMGELPMNTVLKAKEAAEAGKIIPPPEDWISEKPPIVDCVLPEFLDHEITGLIGRNKEAEDLRKMLSGGRINQIAIVARGGLGKTALALDVLQKYSKNPETLDWCDSIVYQSFKDEELTAEGTTQLDLYQGFEDLKVGIANALGVLLEDPENEDFDTACELLKDHRILLCIDNLETVLRDSPDECTDFLYSLPAKWKVLVTTRIPVDGFRTLKLNELSEKSAIGLAHKYLSTRGHGETSKGNIEKIVKYSKCNPLAIRLTADYYLQGKELADAGVTANNEVVKFSFDRLMGSLDKESICLIEILYQIPKIGRSELSNLLVTDLDHLAEIIATLSKTSVVIRQSSDEGEYYSLTPSMREYVLHSPNSISVRDSINSKINDRERRIRYAEQQQRETFTKNNDRFYIPEDLPTGLKEILHRSVRVIKTVINNKKYEKASDELMMLETCKESYDTDTTYRYFLAVLHRLLGDRESAQSHADFVIEQDPSHFQAWLLKGYIASSREDAESLSSAQRIFERLFDQCKAGYFGEILDKDINVLHIGYFKTLFKLRHYPKLIGACQDWQGADDGLKSLIGSYYAIGLCMTVNGRHFDDIHEITLKLQESLKQLKMLMKEKGCNYNTIYALYRILNETTHIYYVRDKDIDDDTSYAILHQIADLIEFIDFNRKGGRAGELVCKLEDKYLPYLTGIKTQYGNPIRLDVKYSKVSLSATSIKLAIDQGFRVVKISRVPHDDVRKNYRFAQADDGEEFYLGLRSLNSGKKLDWQALTDGDFVAIKEGVRPVDGNHKIATKIYIESDF